MADAFDVGAEAHGVSLVIEDSNAQREALREFARRAIAHGKWLGAEQMREGTLSACAAVYKKCLHEQDWSGDSAAFDCIERIRAMPTEPRKEGGG